MLYICDLHLLFSQYDFIRPSEHQAIATNGIITHLLSYEFLADPQSCLGWADDFSCGSIEKNTV